MLRGGSGVFIPTIAVLLLLPSRWTAATPQFIVYPDDVTAPLGTNVTLECVANVSSVAWSINDLQLIDPGNIQLAFDNMLIVDLGEIEELGDGTYRTTITIPATEFVNRSIEFIMCQAGPTDVTLVDGDPFTFTVYGLPLAPGQLEVSGETAHQLSLSWSPPFTLLGETVTYSLLIQDLVTGHNESVGSLTDTQYTHQLTEAEALSCHQYLFSVFSVNDVGPSLSPSSAPPALHPSAPGPLGAVESVVEHNSQAMTGAMAVLTLSFQSPLSCFPLVYSVSINDELTANQPLEVPVSVSSVNGTALIEVPGLRENTRYSATVSAHNNFSFSIENPLTSDPVMFVTSGVQSVTVFQYENGTLRLTCVFAEGTLSTGCRVTLTFDSVTTTNIDIERNGDALEEVHYDTNTRGAPSSVTAQDMGVDNPLVITATITSEVPSGPSHTTTSEMSPSVTPTEMSTHATSPRATPTVSSPDPAPSSGLNLLTWAIPAGVGVAILMLIVLCCCCIVCCRQRSSKYQMERHDTLPHGLPVPHSPSSPSSHDYKQVTHHGTATIKEMSFNPLYGDAPPQTFDPPLPSLPQTSNGYSSTTDTITLPSDLPPMYEEIAAARQAAKLAANPQYGAVGGANGGTPNPQYSSPPGPGVSEDHMYASLKEPGHLSIQQRQPSPYAKPYEHVRPSQTTGGVVNSTQAPPTEGVTISTDDNVSYNVGTSAVSSPQKSL